VPTPSELRVRLDEAADVTALRYAAARPRLGATIVLAHGAGAGQRSPFMTAFATALAALGIDVATFNFLYMEQRRRIPDRRPSLEGCYRAVIGAVHDRMEGAGDLLFIGGKSMGGRIATHVAAADRDRRIAGIVLLGYPLHPPGRPAERRDAHLSAVAPPMLFVQGSRDAFGSAAELEPVTSSLAAATLHIVTGGDHSLRVPRIPAGEQAAVYDGVQRAIVRWIEEIVRTGRSPRSG